METVRPRSARAVFNLPACSPPTIVYFLRLLSSSFPSISSNKSETWWGKDTILVPIIPFHPHTAVNLTLWISVYVCTCFVFPPRLGVFTLTEQGQLMLRLSFQVPDPHLKPLFLFSFPGCDLLVFFSLSLSLSHLLWHFFVLTSFLLQNTCKL